MREELIKFIKSPNRDNYLACYAKLVSSDEYEPYSDEMEKAVELCKKDRIEEAIETLKAAMRNLVLSPRAHQLYSFLFYKLGDSESADFEWMVNRSCIDGILSTGDGSAEKPYIVARISDEYDIIGHFKKEPIQQSLIQDKQKHLELIRCADGSEYWFDITDAYGKINDLNVHISNIPKRSPAPLFDGSGDCPTIIVEHNGKTWKVDSEGFRMDTDYLNIKPDEDWYDYVRIKERMPELSSVHITVLEYIQNYYRDGGLGPMISTLIKDLNMSRRTIYELFPTDTPTRTMWKMAGLPRPHGIK